MLYKGCDGGYRVSHSGGACKGAPRLFDNFLNPATKTDAPPWGIPHLKIKAPHLKNKPAPLKHETPFHEMIPKKAQ